MGNKKMLTDVVNNLRLLASSIEVLINTTTVGNSVLETNPEANEPLVASSEETKTVLTIEKVRAALAEKSQSGKQSEVKALITKFGASKLTDLNPECYAEIIKEAEAL